MFREYEMAWPREWDRHQRSNKQPSRDDPFAMLPWDITSAAILRLLDKHLLLFII